MSDLADFIFSLIFYSFLSSGIFFVLLKLKLKLPKTFNWQYMMMLTFKLLPFLDKLSDNFLLGLDLKNFWISFKWSLIFLFLLKSSWLKTSKNARCGFFCPWLISFEITIFKLLIILRILENNKQTVSF